MSKAEAAMRAALEFRKAFNRHDVAALMQLTSDDCIYEIPDPAPDGAVLSGKEALAAYWQDFFTASPKAQLDVEEVFGYGDRCIMRWRCSWQDNGGAATPVRGVDIVRVRDGSICERQSYVKGWFGAHEGG
jgi:ketosteroid isomerase-like protein